MIVYLFIYLLYNCNLSKYPWHVVCFNIRQSEWLQEAAKYCHSQLPFGLWWWMWLVLLIRSRDVCSASAAFNPYPYSLPFFFAGSRCSMPWWMVRLCFALCSLLFASASRRHNLHHIFYGLYVVSWALRNKRKEPTLMGNSNYDYTFTPCTLLQFTTLSKIKISIYTFPFFIFILNKTTPIISIFGQSKLIFTIQLSLKKQLKQLKSKLNKTPPIRITKISSWPNKKKKHCL